MKPTEYDGRLRLLLASPECTHFSVALGGRPKNDQRRAGAWHILPWLAEKRPEFFVVENVGEFRKWGPLDKKGKAIKAEEGTFFQEWLTAVKEIGYKVEFQLLNAANYGAATSRTRLIVIGRRKSRRKAIPWPKMTHAQGGAGGLLPWVPAYTVIDWSRPVPSIFTRPTPLAPKTLRRIAVGIRKFCQDIPVPFITNAKGKSDANDGGAPLPTMTAHARHLGVAVPFGVVAQNNNLGNSLADPMGTILASGLHHGMATPFITANFGEREGQEPRTADLNQPLPTTTPRGAGNLVVPFMLSSNSGPTPKHAGEPVPTMVTTARPQIITPFMLSTASGGAARGCDQPAPTFTTNAGCQVVIPYVVETAHGDRRLGDVNRRARGVDEPLCALTTKRNQGIALASTMNYYGTGHCDPVTDPLATITAKQRHALVTYYPGTDLPDWDDIDFANVGPMTDKLREKDRHLLYMEASILSGMRDLGIADIGFRLFDNDELALAMGFDPSYIFTGTKTNITKQIGNAVSPILSEAIVRALVS